MNRKKLIGILAVVVIFVYFEFFFLGVQTHQRYVNRVLTKEEAVLEHPSIEWSTTDEQWLKQIWDAVAQKEYREGEYTLEKLEVPSHPKYISANTAVTVSQRKLGFGSTNEGYIVTNVTLSDVEGVYATEIISFGVYSTMGSLEKTQYGDFEVTKGIRCYKESLFSKELPDITYICEYTDNQCVYSRMEMEHEWFALIKQLFASR